MFFLSGEIIPTGFDKIGRFDKIELRLANSKITWRLKRMAGKNKNKQQPDDIKNLLDSLPKEIKEVIQNNWKQFEDKIDKEPSLEEILELVNKYKFSLEK